MKHTVFYFRKPTPYAALYKGEELTLQGYDDDESHGVRTIAEYVGGDVVYTHNMPVADHELDDISMSQLKELVEKQDTIREVNFLN